MISNNSGEFEIIEKLTGGKSRIRFTLTGTEKKHTIAILQEER